MKISPRYFIFGCCIGLFIIYGVLSQLPDGKLHMIFCDVGQGDAILIIFPNGQDMLIDGGPNNRVLSCLGNNRPFYDRTLDLVMATHPQEDHIGGLVEVVKRYNVKHFVIPAVSHTSMTFSNLWSHLKQKQVPIQFVFKGEKIIINNVKMNILWPDKQWLEKQFTHEDSSNENSFSGMITTKTDLNSFSVNLHLQYGQFDALFTGDGDNKIQGLLGQLELAAIDSSIDVLKVPHHGSKTALNQLFLSQLKPLFSVIQVGKNSYGHPNASTIDALHRFGRVFRTDKNGEITISTNGESVDIEVEK